MSRKSQPSGKQDQEHPRGRILVGPAGWSYADWNGIVYPAHRPPGFHEAEYLAQFFDTIEINTSFYNPLKPEMCKQWLARVAANPGFLFTGKLWQRFTHEGGTGAADVAAARAGFDVLHGAGRLGAVLLQFPFSFHNTPENLAHLKKLLHLFREYPLVVEVRHSTWNQREFYEFLHGQGAGFCNIDQPVIGRSIRPSERTTSPVGYVRLHGRRYDTWFTDDPASPPEERYNYLYSAEELDPWAARIGHVAKHSKTTFVITNNHFQGKAIVNALQLIHLLTGEKTKMPEALRQHYPQLEAIASEPAREPTLFPLGTHPTHSHE
ncbi:MAG TPA: DUF72 domain-containing protein [Patescibacteria group bacterium]|nr:DUF72 domain-containing protein [Patescibacteria group bacterium]